MPDQEPRISAERFSSLIDVAGAMGSRAPQFHRGMQQSSSSDSPPTILVRNDTGDVVPRFGILGIADPLILPTDNLSEFQSRVALSGVLPVEGEHESAFVILAEPLADKVIGKATLTGASPVQIDVQDIGHTHTTIRGGEIGFLVSTGNEDGNRILWKEAGTGLRWGVVRIEGGGVGLPTETVVLTRLPTIQDTVLFVRKVIFIDSPPQPARMNWDGDEFMAYPDFGKVVLDYVSLFTLGLPGFGTTYFRLFQHKSDPIVEFPAGESQEALDTVVLTTKPTLSDRTLAVRKVQYAGSPPVQGEYVWVDQPFIVFPDFGHTAIDYAEFFKEVGPEPAAVDTFLRVFQDRGDSIAWFPAAAGGEKPKRFTITLVHDEARGIVDHMEAEDETGTIFRIARPWLLRQTPFDNQLRNSIRYFYNSPIERRAIHAGKQQTQVILPSYQIGDEILATQVAGGTGVSWVDDIEWLEIDQGRAWSRSGL